LTDDAITRFTLASFRPAVVGRQAAAGWVWKSSWRIMIAQPMRARAFPGLIESEGDSPG
jgi:hypothetical protein